MDQNHCNSVYTVSLLNLGGKFRDILQSALGIVIDLLYWQ